MTATVLTHPTVAHPTASTPGCSVPAFADPEELRWLLIRLYVAGPGAWRNDPDANALMRFAMDKYAGLAHKHSLAPGDAAVAAFEAMRTRAVLVARDPWAAITRAVQVTLIAEERAAGLLCETRKARTRAIAGLHDAERFSDRETPVCDFHPAFHVPGPLNDLDRDPQADTETRGGGMRSAAEAVEATIGLFTRLGWPPDTARTAVELICTRLIELGNRPSAFESLRRDRHARVLLDLDQPSWLALLHAVLGNPDPNRRHTATGRGLLLRLVLGEHPSELVAESALVDLIGIAAPGATGVRGGS